MKNSSNPFERTIKLLITAFSAPWNASTTIISDHIQTTITRTPVPRKRSENPELREQERSSSRYLKKNSRKLERAPINNPGAFWWRRSVREISLDVETRNFCESIFRRH